MSGQSLVFFVKNAKLLINANNIMSFMFMFKRVKTPSLLNILNFVS